MPNCCGNATVVASGRKDMGYPIPTDLISYHGMGWGGVHIIPTKKYDMGSQWDVPWDGIFLGHPIGMLFLEVHVGDILLAAVAESHLGCTLLAAAAEQ